MGGFERRNFDSLVSRAALTRKTCFNFGVRVPSDVEGVILAHPPGVLPGSCQNKLTRRLYPLVKASLFGPEATQRAVSVQRVVELMPSTAVEGCDKHSDSSPCRDGSRFTRDVERACVHGS